MKHGAGTRHLFEVEPPINVYTLAKIVLGLVIVFAVSVLWSMFVAVRAVFVSWFGHLLLFFWVIPLAVWVAFLATATSALCVVSA